MPASKAANDCEIPTHAPATEIVTLLSDGVLKTHLDRVRAVLDNQELTPMQRETVFLRACLGAIGPEGFGVKPQEDAPPRAAWEESDGSGPIRIPDTVQGLIEVDFNDLLFTFYDGLRTGEISIHESAMERLALICRAFAPRGYDEMRRLLITSALCNFLVKTAQAHTRKTSGK